MNFPPIVTNHLLAQAAAADEATKVRLALRNVDNLKPYVIHGRGKRHYHFAFDPAANCHVLDVPLSIWMEHVNPPLNRDNPSIAFDILGKIHNCGPIIVLVLPWKVEDGERSQAAEEDQVPGVVTLRQPELFKQLLVELEAPEMVIEGLALAVSTDEGTADKLRALIEEAKKEQEPERKPRGRAKLTEEQKKARQRELAAERMRKKRAKDKGTQTS